MNSASLSALADHGEEFAMDLYKAEHQILSGVCPMSRVSRT
jgi:hypothetical protein